MANISRRKLITTGLSVAAGASGIAVAAKVAQHHGLIPPDAEGFYGPGETLTYAAQRLLSRHAMAREFSPSEISTNPFANEVDPLGDEFKRLQAANFVDWHVTGTEWWLAHPRFRSPRSGVSPPARTSP